MKGESKGKFSAEFMPGNANTCRSLRMKKTKEKLSSLLCAPMNAYSNNKGNGEPCDATFGHDKR